MDIQWEGSDLGRQPGHGPVQPTALEKLVGVVDTGAPGPNPKSAAAAPAPPNIKPRGKNSASSASLVCCEPTADALHLPCFPSSLSREADPEEDAAAMPKGRRKKGAKAQRLVDPAPEVDPVTLINFLAKTHRVKAEELIEFLEVPDTYVNEVPAVKAKNRGLNKIYGKMAHLRRRFLNLLLTNSEDSPEGDYINEKLDVFEQEVIIIQDEVREMGGAFYTTPEVYT